MLVAHIKRRHIYWLSQIVGWSAFGCMMAALTVVSDRAALSPRICISILLETLTGLLLTHAYRAIIRKYRWIKLPIVSLLWNILIGSTLLSVAYFGLIVGIYFLVGIRLPDIDALVFVSSILNHLILFLIWSATYFASGFFSDYRRREIEHLRWEGAIKDFELNKLKSQLNPHFVFNALNSIRSLVEEDPEKAKKGITQLSNILRNSLIADRSKFISLQEEMRTVNDYLNLEKLRYEERMAVYVRISDEALSVPVPPMMIQTLVENAVKHGISQQVESGYIAVDAAVNKLMLTVTIKNSGVLGQSKKTGTGFGILNTRQRLELLYGSQAWFNMEQDGENQVSAALHLPAKAAQVPAEYEAPEEDHEIQNTPVTTL